MRRTAAWPCATRSRSTASTRSSIRLKRNGTVSTIDGIDEDEHEIELRVDHALVKRFTIGGKFKGPDPGVLIAVPEDDKNGQVLHDYRMNADDALEVRLPVKAGTRLVAAAFTDSAAVAGARRRGAAGCVGGDDPNCARHRHAVHLRAVQRQDARGHAEPAAHLHLPPGGGARRGAVRAADHHARWRGAPTAGR